jgi:Leucine-rich repeat (LRR) protein
MKIQLLFWGLICTTLTQAQFTEDFESYNLGSMNTQNLSRWNTWFGTLLIEESLNVVQGNTKEGLIKYTDASNYTDQILNLGNKSTGKWQLELKVKIPTGKSALLQPLGTLTNQGTYNNAFLYNSLYFNIDNANPGVAYIGAQGSANSFTFQHDVYFDLKFVFDLTNNSVRLSVNNVAVGQFPFVTNEATGLGGIDFYAANAFYECYIDDIVLTEVFYPDTILTLNTNFEQALIDLGLDTNGVSGDMLKTEAEAITTLDVSNKNIEDLYGIGRFVNLTNLDASNNEIQNFDGTGLANLISLNLENQQTVTSFSGSSIQSPQAITKLKTINIEASTLLETLRLKDNELTVIDLSNQAALKHLDLENNLLEDFLNLSLSTDLSTMVNISNNNLIGIDLSNGNNTGMSNVNFANNPNLTCIEVDNVSYPPTNAGWVNAPVNSYSLDCSSLYLVDIPDVNFEQALIDAGFDTNGLTGNILKTEAEAVTSLSMVNKNISDLTGIEYFTNVTFLNIFTNNISTLSLVNNVNLNVIGLNGNPLTYLDITGVNNITTLYIGDTSLDNADIAGLNLTSLQFLDILNITDLSLTGNLDLSLSPVLRNLDARNNSFSSANIANGNNTMQFAKFTANPNLTCIQVDDATLANGSGNFTADTGAFFSEDCNNLVLISIPDANFEQALIDLGYDTNGLTGDMYQHQAERVYSLFVHSKNITSLSGIAYFTNLITFYGFSNNIVNVSFVNNTKLQNLGLAGNPLTSIDLTGITNLKNLYLGATQLDDADIAGLNIPSFPSLQLLSINNLSLTGDLDLSQNGSLINVNINNNNFSTVNIANGNNTNLTTFSTTSNPNLSCIKVDDVPYANSAANWDKDATATYSTGCTSDFVLIPDANFEQALIDAGIDTNGFTGNILKTEAEAATSLNLFNKSISNLSGLNAFINLIYLNITDNTVGNSMDISNLPNLETLNATNAGLTGVLTLSGNTNLKNLYGDNNVVTSVNFSNSNLIENINLASSNLTTLDVTNFNLLKQVDVSLNSGLTSIDLTQNPLLERYYHNQVALTSTDFSGNPVLKEVSLYFCQLTTLDLSNNPQLEKIWMGSNKIPTFNYTVFPNLKVLNVYQPYPGFEFTAIDLSNNLDLETLVLSYNKIETLDLSSHTKLTQVYMYNNSLTSFNIKNGTNNLLQNLSTKLNPNLSCILVDDVAYSTTNWPNIDATSTFVANDADCTALLSVEENYLNQVLSIYPNPTANSVHIQVPNDVQVEQINVYNVLGQKVNTQFSNNMLNLSKLHTGMYLVTIYTNKGNITKRISKL